MSMFLLFNVVGREVEKIVQMVIKAWKLAQKLIIPLQFIINLGPPGIPPFSKMAAVFQNGHHQALVLDYLTFLGLQTFYFYLHLV